MRLCVLCVKSSCGTLECARHPVGAHLFEISRSAIPLPTALQLLHAQALFARRSRGRGPDPLLLHVKRTRHEARQALLGQQAVLPLAARITRRDPDPPFAIYPRRQLACDARFLLRRQRTRLGWIPPDLHARRGCVDVLTARTAGLRRPHQQFVAGDAVGPVYDDVFGQVARDS